MNVTNYRSKSNPNSTQQQTTAALTSTQFHRMSNQKSNALLLNSSNHIGHTKAAANMMSSAFNSTNTANIAFAKSIMAGNNASDLNSHQSPVPNKGAYEHGKHSNSRSINSSGIILANNSVGKH